MQPISPHNILQTSLLQRMSPADFKFAKQQLQLIYSREMSKVSLNLEKREKVHLNLETQEQIKQEILKHQQLALFDKLQKAELKRKLINEKRSRIREIKELKWMERKERAESTHQREIAESERKQREIIRDLEDYRNKKNNKSNLIQKSSYHSPQHEETYYQYVYQSTQKYKDKRKQQQKQRQQEKVKQKQKEKLPQISKPFMTEQRHKALKLNRSILQHQKKKRRIHEEKQDQILKEYIHRIQNIQRKRDERKKKSRSEQNKKLEPSQYRIPKSKEREFRNRSRNRNSQLDREDASGIKSDRDRSGDYQYNKERLDQYEVDVGIFSLIKGLAYYKIQRSKVLKQLFQNKSKQRLKSTNQWFKDDQSIIFYLVYRNKNKQKMNE